MRFASLSVPISLGIILAADVLHGVRVAVFDVELRLLDVLGGLTTVGSSNEDDGVALTARGPINIGGQAHAVTHADHDVFLNDHPVPGGSRKRHWYVLVFP